MKKFLSTIKTSRLLFMILLLAVRFISAAGPKNVSILKFTAQNAAVTEAEIVSDLLAVSLVKARQFRVLDRANMTKILQEQQFQQTGCTDSSCAVEIGQILNMDYMITGTLAFLGGKYFITVNIISVETSQVIQSEKSPGFLMENVEGILDDLAILITRQTKDEPTKETVKNKSTNVKTQIHPEKFNKKPVKNLTPPDLLKIKKSMLRNIVFTGGSALLTGTGLILGYAFNSSTEKTYASYLDSYDSQEARALGNKVDSYKSLANVFYTGGEACLILTGAFGAWAVIDIIRYSKMKKITSVGILPVIGKEKGITAAFSMEF